MYTFFRRGVVNRADEEKEIKDTLTSVATCVLHHHGVAQWLCLVNHFTEVVMPTWEIPCTQTQTGTQTCSHAEE